MNVDTSSGARRSGSRRRSGEKEGEARNKVAVIVVDGT